MGSNRTKAWDFVLANPAEILAPDCVTPVGSIVRTRSSGCFGKRHQLSRLHRIIALKQLGLSLGQIGTHLDDLSAEHLRGMLLMKRAELQEHLSAVDERLTQVELRIHYIEREDHVTADIFVKTVPELRVAAIRCDAPGLDFYNMAALIAPAFRELHERLEAAGVRPNGPSFIFYEMGPDDGLLPRVAVDIGDQQIPVDDALVGVMLPRIEAAATVLDGLALSAESHDVVGPVYGELARWDEDQSYAIRGPGRDVFVDRVEGKVILELQLPVERG
jgi:DNA-binding transcriptional MerR regulator